MKKSLISLTLGLALCGTASAFELSSLDIKPNSTLKPAQVFSGFGCTGDNMSPQLAWKNAPKDTKSFAVTVYDPDAPTGSGWWHWVVWDIPASTTDLPAAIGKGGTLPAGAKEGRTDFGATGFGGACPPVGHKAHRYIFTVHALKVEKLELPENPTAALVGYMLNANSLGKASFQAKYGR